MRLGCHAGVPGELGLRVARAGTRPHGWVRPYRLRICVSPAAVPPGSPWRGWRALRECALDEFADQMEVVGLGVAAFGDGTDEVK